MSDIPKGRDTEIVEASVIPETALHSPVAIRTQFSHGNFLFTSAIVIDVSINWLYMLKLKARPFHPVAVAVNPTGWYIVFANSTQSSANMRQCFDQLNNQIITLPVILSCIQLQQTFAIEVHLGNGGKIRNGANFTYQS